MKITNNIIGYILLFSSSASLYSNKTFTYGMEVVDDVVTPVSNEQNNTTSPYLDIVSTVDFQQKSKNLRRVQSSHDVLEVIPNMSVREIQSVMDWIGAEMSALKIPFCWKPSYGRGVGTLPGRQADCPQYYVNDGLTCRRPIHQFKTPTREICPTGFSQKKRSGKWWCIRAENKISAPNKSPLSITCPSGYSYFALLKVCMKGAKAAQPIVRCPNGYYKHSALSICLKRCPSGYNNSGGFCVRPEEKRERTCPSGYFMKDWKCRKNCPQYYNYVAAGGLCKRNLVIKGVEAMTCKAGERKKGARCYPANAPCYGGEEQDAGLCYPTCNSGFYGVGPVCWGKCSSSQVHCGAACATSTSVCVEKVATMVVDTFMLAVNVATMGFVPKRPNVSSESTKLLKISGKTVEGTTKTSIKLARAAKTLAKFTKKGVTAAGKFVVKRMAEDTAGNLIEKGTIELNIDLDGYVAMRDYRKAYAEDFVAQTSPKIAAELDSRFSPKVAKFLKGLWGEMQFSALKKANDWEIAQTVLDAVSIVDPTGVVAVVAAYAKPVCATILPFPCTSFDKLSKNKCSASFEDFLQSLQENIADGN